MQHTIPKGKIEIKRHPSNQKIIDRKETHAKPPSIADNFIQQVFYCTCTDNDVFNTQIFVSV